ncbi:MAG TPA: 16S rRNA (cytidine(1402)-2'-O)-methyltransferase [Actinomycetota bacterium]|nr:16S rRNA (cytidine(1402)-2'-O)-methyltransferase [Actinomycetota bacterium]
MGKLILCGTPIGNLEDMSPRAVRVLSEADVIACEDTRRTRKLLSHHGIAARSLVVYNETNERRRAKELVATIASGRTVVLVSDAGMPGLSDPGFRLVKACADDGLVVEAVPGPSAVITAVAISGLAPGRFVFEGFVPRKPGDRRRRLEELRDERRTIVFFESPHRIEATLSDLVAAFGPRPAALARELTKMHEEVRRGTVAELLDSVRSDPPRGEIVLVIGGAIHENAPDVVPETLAARARQLMDEGIERKEAMTRVARETGVRRRAVFDALVESED